MTKKSGLVMVILALGALNALAWERLEVARAESAGTLRGFGKVETVTAQWKDGADVVHETLFKTKGEENADAILGKFLYDLEQSDGVRRQTVAGAPVHVTKGGVAFLLAKKTIEARIYAAARVDALERFLTAHAKIVPFAVADAQAPAYMKRFRWGVYGMGGLENFHDWMVRAGAKKGEMLDPKEDFDFLKQMGDMRFDNWLQEVSMDNSDGIIEPNGVHWKAKLAEEMGIQYAYRVYMPMNGYGWAARRFSEHLEQPAPWMNTAWLRDSQAHQPHFSWYDREIWEYFANETKKIMCAVKTPAVQGWMNPVGEVAHRPWYDIHADYSPVAQKSWRDYLAAKDLSLAALSEMYVRAEKPFQDMEQVPVPEFATFTGLPGMVLDLEGTWWTKGELDASPATAAWWKLPAADRYPGIKEKWFAENLDLTDWSSLVMPGNLKFHDFYNARAGRPVDAKFCTRWFRRTFDWSRARAGGKRVYFYFHPISDQSVHAPGTLTENGKPVDRTRHHQLYLNGTRVGDMGAWCGIDVTDLLREGPNTVAIQLHAKWWQGRVFLSTLAPAFYPNLGAARNRLFEYWNEWRMDCKDRACRTIFEGMRQADPNAPIKMMAPLRLGQIRTNKMMADYGGHSHFTGEGLWFFPWYKRYAKVYGTQGTSELAGPYHTIEGAETSTLRVFLAGLDAHEPVFLTQTYSRNKPVRDWWLKHRDLLKRMGTYDIHGPQIYIYRRTALAGDGLVQPYPAVGGATKEMQSPWDWDLGRGSFQSIGQSYLYLDDDGIADGKMYGAKLMVDCASGVIPPAQTARIRDWVKAGGVFVAFPFTAWTGAKIAAERPLGGTVVFERDAPYFKAFAGRTFPDTGRQVNCNGANQNTHSAELEAGADDVVVARYENGKPAIVVTRLGEGLVVTLGTLFWKDCADVKGIWWPGALESQFLRELVKTVGADAALYETDNPLVWAQPYRAHNGLDAVACLCNFNPAGTTQRVTLTMRLAAKPRALTRYWEGGTTETPFTWDAATKTATATFDMPGYEVCVVNAEAHDAADAVCHWWRENQISWRELKRMPLDLAAYDRGKWRNPTQDLKTDAVFTQVEPKGTAWLEGGFDAKGWRACSFDPLQFYGARENAKAWVRKTFDLDDATWLQGGQTRLVTGTYVGKNFLTKGRVFLNGVEILPWGIHRHAEPDVTKLLKAKGNVLAIEFDAGEKYTGMNGALYLYHRSYAAKSFPLDGAWTMRDGKTITLPGAYRKASARRRVFIPAAWKGRYKVRLYMEGPRGVPMGVVVNDKGFYMRKHHHNFGNVTDIDITNFLAFGEENTLALMRTQGESVRDEDFDINVSEIRLDLFETK